MLRALTVVPVAAAMQAAPIGPAPVTFESVLIRAVEQLPLVAVIIWLWVRDSARRDKREEQQEARFYDVVQQLVAVCDGNTRSNVALQQTLEGRPCLAGRIVNEPKPVSQPYK